MQANGVKALIIKAKCYALSFAAFRHQPNLSAAIWGYSKK